MSSVFLIGTHADSEEIIVAIKLRVVIELVKLILRHLLKMYIKSLLNNVELDPSLS